MKAIIQLFLLTIIITTGVSSHVFAVNYYWVGGSGNWNDVAHWATSSGNVNGSMHTLPPSVNDDVFFDASSFDPAIYSPNPSEQAIVSINANAFCASMIWTGALTRPILSGTSTLTIGGALTLIPDMDITFSGPIVFASNNTSTPNIITSAGKVFQGSIQFSNAGLWELADAMGIIKDMTIANGILDAKNQIITSNGNWTITNPGRFTSGTGTVILTGADIDKEIKVDPGNPFYNLTIDKNNSSILLKSKIQVNNELNVLNGTLKDEGYQINETLVNNSKISVSNGAGLTLGDDDPTNGSTTFPRFANITLAANSTVNYRDRATPQIVLGTNYGNLILSNGPIASLNVKPLIASATVAGNLTVGPGIDFRDNGFQITGNTTAGKSLKLEGNATLTLGNATTNPATIFPHFGAYDLNVNSTVNYNSGFDQTIKALTGTGNASYGNLTLTNATTTMSTKTLFEDGNLIGGNVNVRGNLNIGINNTLDVSANNWNISIQGNWTSFTNTGNFNNSGLFNARNGKVIFSGGNAQTITVPSKILPPTSDNPPINDNRENAYAFNILRIEKNASVNQVELLSAVTVSNNVEFIRGKILSGIDPLAKNNKNKELIFLDLILPNNHVATTTATNDSYVIGSVKKIGNDAFIFPIGDQNFYRPSEVSRLNNGTQQIAMQYFNRSSNGVLDGRNNPININSVQTIDNGQLKALNGPVSKYEYWSLRNDNPSSANPKINISWQIGPSGPVEYLGDLSKLVVAAWSPDQLWENRGGAAQKNANEANQPNYYGNGNGRIIGTEAMAGVLNFFTIGTIAVNALPIDLLYFQAKLVNSQVQFSWATAKEVNNDYFTVEKSADGVNFETLLEVDGAGNSQQLRKYSATDASPYNDVTYYRLKQTDFDGKYEYSKTEAVYTHGTQGSLLVSSPGRKQIHISCQLPDSYSGNLTIHNSQGLLIWSKTVSANAAGNILNTDVPVAASGLYVVSLQHNTGVIIKKLIVP